MPGMVPMLDSLLAPPRCMGCGADGPPWCRICAATTPADPTLRDLGMPVIAVHAFEGPLRRVVIAWKEEGRAEARRLVQRWLSLALGPLRSAMPGAIVVAIPSSPSAERRRGLAHLEQVLAAVCPEDLRTGALRSVGARADQSTLGRVARARNMAGAFAWEGPTDRPVIVVDDIVTTGATMRAAAATLHASGVERAVGLTLAWRPESTLLRGFERGYLGIADRGGSP